MAQESPFYDDSPSSSFFLYLEPILNSYYGTYQKVITLSDIPEGPLGALVKRISVPRLSPFYDTSPLVENVYRCTNVLLRFPIQGSLSSIKYSSYFMTEEDIPLVIRYLLNQRYTIEQTAGYGLGTNQRRVIGLVRYLH
jgi:hypothetical protein